MPVDYDVFRSQSWSERLRIFNRISVEEKAGLVRTHISRWLAAHRDELTEAQIGIVEENIAVVTSEIYVFPASANLTLRLQDLEARTASLLSRDK